MYDPKTYIYTLAFEIIFSTPHMQFQRPGAPAAAIPVTDLHLNTVPCVIANLLSFTHLTFLLDDKVSEARFL